MKTGKHFVHILLCSIILVNVSEYIAYCQTTDYKKAFEEFSLAAKRIHHAFGDSVNTAFSTAVKSNWEEFNVYEAECRGGSPQPIVVPPSEKASAGETTISVVETIPNQETIDGVEPIRSHQAAAEISGKTVSFAFYGTMQSVKVPYRYGTFHPSSISEASVGEFWALLSESEYSLILVQCENNRISHGYNDWMTFEWVKALAVSIFPNNIYSERTIFTVFIMNQLGMKVKLARTDQDLEEIFACRQTVYGRKYTVVDTYRYYFPNDAKPRTSIFTYRLDFNQDVKPIDLRIHKAIDLGADRLLVNRKCSSLNSDILLPLNESVMTFYGAYPQTDIDVYASALPSNDFSEALLGKLKDKIQGFGVNEIINEILRFIQYDFKYQTDEEQFGHEKPFFIEENFFYEANDCEDRAALFSYIVRLLTDRSVILLEWSDHIAAAVNLQGNDINGCSVKVKGEKYYICDPTYLGATIGMCMPQYIKEPAKVYIL